MSLRPRRRGHALARSLHHAALRAVDLTSVDRRVIVEAMFRRQRRDTVGYWLQSVLSMAIATVGLVLGSTAVVIGGMLIAPLMGPILELGMGLVLGSAVLTIRSFVRMAGSVIVVVGGATLLTMMLPFQEITSEISTRASPTALDLLVAVLVAVAAAFTTARPGSETTSAAAGTAVGIALVPPLCVIGFGLGTRDLHIASGASLLFLTNLMAIVVVAVSFFWLLGFGRVAIVSIEDAALTEMPQWGVAHRAVLGVRAVFGSRYGAVVRVGLPVLLIAALFLPLSRALDQVAWEVKARSSVRGLLASSLESRSALPPEVSIGPGTIRIQLYVVGTGEESRAIEQQLTSGVAARTGVVPTVHVVAVPDAAALGRVVRAPEVSQLPLDLPTLRQRIDQAVTAAWPDSTLGAFVSWRLEMADSAGVAIAVRYLGESGGATTDALLGRAISESLGLPVSARAVAWAPGTVSEPAARASAWLPAFQSAVEAVRDEPRLRACVTLPAADALRRSATLRRAAERVREAADSAAGRVVLREEGMLWQVRRTVGPCPSETAPDRAVAGLPAGP